MKIDTIILVLISIYIAITAPVISFAQSDYEKQTAGFSIDLAKKIKESNKTKVAVSDFLDNDGNLTELGKAIAEDIGVGIVNEGKGAFQVMERSNLNAILKEQKLSSTGLIDPETAKQLGKLKMVDAVIVGNITPFGNSFRVTIKILDTETGMSIAAASGNLAGTDDIKGLFNKKITIFNASSKENNIELKNKTHDKTAADMLFDVGVTEMRKAECEIRMGNYTLLYGQVCFENKTDDDLIFTSYDEVGANDIYITEKTFIPKDARNCSQRIRINVKGGETPIKDVTFTFYTTTNPARTGTFTLTLEKCKVKSVVLTKKNLYLK